MGVCFPVFCVIFGVCGLFQVAIGLALGMVLEFVLDGSHRSLEPSFVTTIHR